MKASSKNFKLVKFGEKYEKDKPDGSTYETKEEKKRKKELKKVSMQQEQTRDFLIRESNFNEISSKRGWTDWKEWCEGVKINELREDLNALTQSIDHMTEHADNAIETIKEHRQNGYEQNVKNVGLHTDLIDYITDLYKLFQASSHNLFELERDHLIKAFYKEATECNIIHDKRKHYYENLAHATVSLLKCKLQKSEESFINQKIEIESESFVKRENDMEKALKCSAVACFEIRNLVNMFNNALWPGDRLNQYYSVLHKDNEIERIIKDLTAKIESSHSLIAKLEGKLESSSYERLIKTAELKSEERFMTKLFEDYKRKCQRETLKDSEMIKHLVITSDEVKKKLKTRLEKGKSILKAMKVCLKYEKLTDTMGSFESFESSEYKKLEDLTDFFFKKLSRVEAEVLMLRNYKTKMLLENEKLNTEVKEKSLEAKVDYNLKLLRLNPTSSKEQTHQISHQIVQIKTPINLRKRFKLCKSCRHSLD